ncbi:hypothetical protein CBF34_02665 [Vagococcus penaei]|uniref:Uncharacterized protein n=1 Tax=Vagococcus penaei TaxID=633807 RepID=A0A1Q2D4C2_9ENTE|nr:CDP-glycerol glycerophosphotransferase family protein [Vagococcus penaei]AQP53107.1 hypothetical protein BW732_01925 [Vagococcus penaei]RSU06031.1 hypothetical protein CBF34_02665 [Vagococcus penaei]
MKKFIEKVISQLFTVIGRFPKAKLVYFESFHGKQYSDNPRAIYQFMEKNYPDYQLVWGVTKGYEELFESLHIPYVTRFSIKWFFIMPRAKTWVINTRTPLWLTKPKTTTYLQTWHGTPLKKIGCDIKDVKIPGYTKESYNQEVAQEAARWDYLIAPNQYSEDIFRQAFHYQGAMLEYGYPRNDELYPSDDQGQQIMAIKRRLGIPFNQRVVLYAPTWRETETHNGRSYDFTLNFPFDEITDNFTDDLFLLVRMHYLVAKDFDFSDQVNILDVSTGVDMSDLLLVSDLLITDYSSCMFDYSLTNRPIIYYLPDRAEYERELRGFYFDLDHLIPGPIANHRADLLRLLVKFIHYPEKLKTDTYTQFRQLFSERETGHNAELIVRQVFKDERGI